MRLTLRPLAQRQPDDLLDRAGRDSNLRGDPRVGRPVTGHQQHAGALRITMRRRLSADQLLKHRSLFIGHRQWSGRRAHSPSYSADVIVLEGPRLFLGQDDHLARGLCETLEHPRSIPVRRPVAKTDERFKGGAVARLCHRGLVLLARVPVGDLLAVCVLGLLSDLSSRCPTSVS